MASSAVQTILPDLSPVDALLPVGAYQAKARCATGRHLVLLLSFDLKLPNMVMLQPGRVGGAGGAPSSRGGEDNAAKWRGLSQERQGLVGLLQGESLRDYGLEQASLDLPRHVYDIL